MKIITVIGARPQFIKASAISRLVRSRDDMTEIIVHTGQHYDDNMSDVFFRELDIEAPKYRFETGGQGHGAMTGRQLEEIEKVLLTERPDVVLVYGDTNSTLAGALAAVKLHIPVAHVEAGLRSYNRRMPEEINRVLTDHMSEWLFVPTAVGAAALAQEGVDPRRVLQVGDVMYDVALYFGEKARVGSRILERLHLDEGRYAVATLHRAENVDAPATLQAMLAAMRTLAETIPIVLPVHPRTRSRLIAAGIEISSESRIKIVEPLGYLDMTRLVQGARIVLTDSGGLQKEAFFHRVPCVTLRTETEWTELVELGWNRLPTTFEASAINLAIAGALAGNPDPNAAPYGDGTAGQKILDHLANGHVPLLGRA